MDHTIESLNPSDIESLKSMSQSLSASVTECTNDAMTQSKTVVITGAFSYTGKYATRILLSRGYEVCTLTNHPATSRPDRAHPFGDRVQVFPYNFDRPDELRRSLQGAVIMRQGLPPKIKNSTTEDTEVHRERRRL